MSLNDIQLSASQLTDWYRRHLVVSDEPGAPAATTPPPVTPGAKTAEPPTATAGPKPLQWLGNHQKKVGILVSYPKEAYLPEAELNFLSNILLACRMNLGDVAIVNHAHYPLLPSQLREQLESDYLLVFGVSPADPALSQQPSFVPLALDGYTVVLAPALHQLNVNNADGKQLKSKLWICLKQLFNV
jgi:hypothetical protein